jgi:spermidine synthase
MTALFTLSIFFSATLLFMVQPLAGKILLPVLGGSPAVWSTCMVFFQAVLLLGYVYAHALSTRVPLRWQRPVHVCVLIAASMTLPLTTEIGDPGGSPPRMWLLRTLASTVGLPFFALSATAPLLQQWFSRTNDPQAKDPYFLYAASNAGSLLGLLGYLLVELGATRSVQVSGWSVAFWGVAALVTACAYASARVRRPQRADLKVGTTGTTATTATTRTTAPKPRRTRNTRTGTSNPEVRTPNLELRTSNREPTGSDLLSWIALALVPSALLLGVTQHLATDVVSAPLLWIVPLALYLITFIAAFSNRTFGSAAWWGRAAPVVVLVVLVLSLAEVRYPIVPITVAHLAAFAVLAMVCHVRLAESRPHAAHLTGYFVCIALGGVLGGTAMAFIAPAVSASILEYPIAIGAAILLRPQSAHADRIPSSAVRRWAWRAGAATLFLIAYWGVSAFNARANTGQLASNAFFRTVQSATGNDEIAQRMLRASFAIPALLFLITPRTALLFAGTAAGLLVSAAVVRTGGEVLYRERTFFGVSEVTSQQNGDWHVLTHGTTTHGVQAFRGKVRMLPTAYYHPSGPIGDVVLTLSADARFRDIAVVGLGAGALAGYAGDGVRMDFFEVDEAVIRIAENPQYFTYLAEARARPGTRVRTIPVDGRLGLRAMPEASYDLIVVDAFSSDAIPTHLITREAVAMFKSRLKPRGVMAFHVSSRFFDLGPVLARIAEDQHLVSYMRNDDQVAPERAAEAMRPSVWVVLARDEQHLGQLAHSAPRWARLSGSNVRLWTDDYTNMLGVLHD